MKTVIIYPGRFQPFGKHHNEIYKWLVGKFGVDNVFITTSNHIDEKSPLTFNEKSQIIQRFGINKNNICQADKPYMPTNLLKGYDKDSDRLIVVYGEKDYGRLSFNKKDGTASYFKNYTGQKDLDSFKNSAYVLVAPHVQLNHNGNEICGTYLRQVLSSGTNRDMLDLMGWSDENTLNLFKDKFSPDFKFIKEAVTSLEENRITITQLQRIEQYADAMFYRFGIDVEFSGMIKDSHFYQRLNDPRNNPPIEAEEIRQLFKKVSQKYGELLSKENDKVEGVLRDMSSDINIPFIIKWDKQKKELDLIPKTIMRKKDFYTSDTLYKVEQFKSVLEANTTNQGKYTRHIMHPHENDMTFSELKRFVFDVTKNTESIESCTLKLDGYNLQVTYKNGEVLCSRNKTTIVSPMNYTQLKEKYKSNPDSQFAFCESLTAMTKALSTVDQSYLNQIFKNGSTFLNFEILHERATNVFKCDFPALSIHSLITYDSQGNESYRSTTMPKEIGSLFGKTYGQFIIKETTSIELNPIQDAELYNKEILDIQKRYRIPEPSIITQLPIDVQTEIKRFIFDLGNAVIRSNYPKKDHNYNINRIIGIVEEVSDNLENDTEYKTFEDSMKMLDNIGGYKSINSIEGLVLSWNNRTLKLTGSFGCLVPVFNLWNKKRF